MEDADSSKKQIDFEQEIGYSQDAISNNFIFGGLLLLKLFRK
jgi:hypothetical protein